MLHTLLYELDIQHKTITLNKLFAVKFRDLNFCVLAEREFIKTEHFVTRFRNLAGIRYEDIVLGCMHKIQYGIHLEKRS